MCDMISQFDQTHSKQAFEGCERWDKTAVNHGDRSDASRAWVAGDAIDPRRLEINTFGTQTPSERCFHWQLQKIYVSMIDTFQID